MSQISESKTKLVWILPSVRDFARRAMSQISDFLSFRGSGRSVRFLTYWISTQQTHLVGINWSMVRMLFKICIMA